MDIQDICNRMNSFVNSKGWYKSPSKKTQTPKNLAVSLSIESAELLECFQWEENAKKDIVADELADIIMYACQIANVMEIDLNEALVKKFDKNDKRTWE
jgi:NTP pyrophosphatase (non-canonical NTP hydrolase)